ncbi:DUF1697 domain-containing protein [Pseudonocardia abyssalis]|uniref:DUF1697 domain-containing protein n=1 Tax=Pseudonocardia abyssalis TaxID=2792008 RepID=A0ABS6UXF0_9PSEU|nr:DUF1697 domain-containing protein [Pseudonocardia abyssalis]MBW0119407.1 DUF1697 domain-containing protein [Pseudonocardia abyssalis]MBW0136379.1 DUF1697 domain-containing protein [Pseudonocardia abyssalis]
MTRFVVLLRGINVGTAKRLAMADLRDLLGELGFSAVRTHLNSGNATVSGPDGEHVPRIEAALRGRFGFEVRTVVLTADELRAIVDGNPFAEVATNGSRMMAHVLSATPDPALLAEHDVAALDPDGAALGPRVIYQWCPDGLLAAPPLAAFAEKHLGITVTARNWNTVTKLDSLL